MQDQGGAIEGIDRERKRFLNTGDRWYANLNIVCYKVFLQELTDSDFNLESFVADIKKL